MSAPERRKANRCTFQRSDGYRCRQRSNLNDTAAGLVCLWHDPSRTTQKKEAQAKGGRASRRKLENVPPAPSNQLDIEAHLRWLYELSINGKIDPRRAKEGRETLAVLHRAMGHRLGLEKRAAVLLKRLDKLDASNRGTLAVDP